MAESPQVFCAAECGRLEGRKEETRMRVKILKRSFAGAEFAPDVRVRKVGGQCCAGVE